MEILSQIQHYGFWFLVVLTVLVFIHELGHFAVARWCGVRVEVFSIGFGPELFGWTDRLGTRWKFSWLPLGGYVRMFGQADSALEGEAARPMSDAERAVSFKDKNVWQRMAIVAAGPAANFLFAVLVLALIYAIVGKAHTDPVVGMVAPDSAAAKAGLQSGDRVLALNGAAVDEFMDIDRIVQLNLDRPLALEIQRGGNRLQLTAHPVIVEDKDLFGNVLKMPQLGITPHIDPVVGDVTAGLPAEAAGLRRGDRFLALNGTPVTEFGDIVAIIRKNLDKPVAITIERDGKQLDLAVQPKIIEVKDESGQTVRIPRLGIGASDNRPLVREGPVAAFISAVQEVYTQSVTILTGLWQMISLERSGSDIRGVGGIAQMAGDVATLGFIPFCLFAVMLSINLGLINLFPVPILDGGHLVYYAVEAVRGKPLGERAQEFGLKVGLALVLSLMLFATWNDLVYFKVVDFVKSLFT
ncbi:RIP metalloprotease RseP [Dongia sp.]|uniref:RIP metalloprotease RseP n=1 Tax=Dongia sp. TaxID=1977262 RepID=UPI003753C3B4